MNALEILKFCKENGFSVEISSPSLLVIDSEVAAAMKDAGIRETIITPETGNENTFKNIIRKPGSLEKAKEAIRALRKEDILAISNIIIGFPSETKEDIEKCIDNLLDFKSNWYVCFIAMPLPGTELFEQCINNKYFVNDFEIYNMSLKKCVIQTDNFTPQYIEKKVYEMNLKLNFVCNYDMRNGEYNIPLLLFKRVIDTSTDTHAFAYYFSAVCCKKLGLNEDYLFYKQKYFEMIERYSFWKEWADHFKLQSFDSL
jgi:radical SAM superfamily enzyme YgiQ (UPF0313 family)